MFELLQVGEDGFVFGDVDVAERLDGGTVFACGVVVETEDALTFGSDADELECEAFADAGEVEYTAVGGGERAFVFLQVAVGCLCVGSVVLQDVYKFALLRLVQDAVGFFFHAFLHGACDGGIRSIIFVKTFYGEGIVWDDAVVNECFA